MPNLQPLLIPVLIGAFTYLPIYLGLVLIVQLPGAWLQNPWIGLLMSAYNMLMLPTCGYMAARRAQGYGLLVGAASGVLIALVSTTISALMLGADWYGASLMASALGLMLKYGFYSALGGAVGELYSPRGMQA